MSWPLVSIGDYVENVSSWNPLKSASQIPFFYIDLSSVDKDKKELDRNSISKVLPSEAPSRARQLVKSGDVLVATVRPNLNGVALVSEEYEDATASTGYCILRPNIKKLDGQYLYYWVQNTTFVADMIGKASGANYPAVSDKIIKESKIPLPPLAEQQRIAAILDEADAIRRKRQQAIQLADDFLRAVFLDMFGDPVTNPKGWEVSSLRDLIHMQGGFAFKSGEFSDSGIPVVKIGNANKVGFTTKEIAFVMPKKPEKLVQYELYPGDLLMSLTGTVGKDDYANVTEVTDHYEKYYLNQRVARISIKSERINKEYLKFLLAHPKLKGEMTKNNRGIRQANISNSDIYELMISVPDTESLEKFEKLVMRSKDIINNLKKCPDLEASLFSVLSQKAFAGKL
ncbi:MAG: restriction endonuclease subunit S [Oleibacter sp.]|nr:restriction endonuclease subunit S [Thalassolituus sp.]